MQGKTALPRSHGKYSVYIYSVMFGLRIIMWDYIIWLSVV